MKGGKRGRKRARDAKYSIGVDLASPGTDDFSAIVAAAANEDGTITIYEAHTWRDDPSVKTEMRPIGKLGEWGPTMTSANPLNFTTGVFYGPVTVIEGEAVEVERRPERLLDAGGPES